jgi:AI-2 transport protein TqsA
MWGDIQDQFHYNRSVQGNKVITGSLVLIVLFIFGAVLKLAKPILFPFALAVFMSFVLSPLLNLMTRFRIPRLVSIVIILLFTFLLLFLLGNLFYSSGKAFAAEFPKYGEKISSMLNSLSERWQLSRLGWQPINWEEQLNINRIGSLFLSALGPFFSFFSTLFLVLFFLIFILAGRGRVQQKVSTHFPSRDADQILAVFDNIDSQIQRYLTIKTLVSLVTGILATIVLFIFGVDFAIVFGFLTFLLNYIPNIGSFMATAFPVLIALFQFGSIWKAIWILVILIVIQQVLGTIVEPRVMGKGLGLSPLFILFSLIFWGWLWGIPGMLLAVPITAVVKIVCSNVPSLEWLAVMMSR